MLFINISSDKIYVYYENNVEIIESRNLEQIFPKFLKNLYNKKFIDKIYVLNGPWSFTSLRISTLCLNVLNFLYNDKISFYSISKIDFYKKIFLKWYLPKNWIIFIGQKKNLWKYDFSKDEYELVSWEFKTNEMSSDFPGIDNSEYFLDIFSFDWNIENQLSFLSHNKIIFKWKEIMIDWDEFNLASVKSLQPNYIIWPNVTVKSF